MWLCSCRSTFLVRFHYGNTINRHEQTRRRRKMRISQLFKLCFDFLRNPRSHRLLSRTFLWRDSTRKKETFQSILEMKSQVEMLLLPLFLRFSYYFGLGNRLLLYEMIETRRDTKVDALSHENEIYKLKTQNICFLKGFVGDARCGVRSTRLTVPNRGASCSRNGWQIGSVDWFDSVLTALVWVLTCDTLEPLKHLPVTFWNNSKSTTSNLLKNILKSVIVTATGKCPKVGNQVGQTTGIDFPPAEMSNCAIIYCHACVHFRLFCHFASAIVFGTPKVQVSSFLFARLLPDDKTFNIS